MDVTTANWNEWQANFQRQRQAAVTAAQQMAAQSNFYSSEQGSESDEDDEGESECESSDDDFGGVPSKLRYAVLEFNIRSDEDGSRFQWFTETIEGPLEVLPVQAEHRKGCELCNGRPTFGEVYFK